MILYKTVEKEGIAEYEVQKSRFIARIAPVQTKEEAEAYIAAVKKEHWNARHNVPAMVIGDNSQIQWASDDGEPQGTAGAPIVQLLTGQEITNVVMVVTRYFGGIKLGTGGLVRAYTAAAKLALQEAGIRTVKEVCEFRVVIDYAFFDKVKSLAESRGFVVADVLYEDKVTMVIQCDAEERSTLQSVLSEATGGKEKIISECMKSA